MTAFRELIDLLGLMLQLYRALHAISINKKDEILQNRLEELMASSNKEARLLKQLSEIEPQVKSLATKLQRELGLRPKLKITLTEIRQMVSNPNDKQELAKLQSELVDIVDKLKKTNELNQQLLQQSMEYVDFSLDVMVGNSDEEYTYKKPAVFSPNQKRPGMFDSRI